ncbi:MAG: sirohydrochlorin chelatase [Opitutales bacterium]
MKTVVYLVDNGSLRPEAAFELRRLAGELSERTGERVEPVSLLHSHKIDPARLGGVPATIVRRRLKESVAEGVRRVVVLPLFLAPSRAITEYLPELLAEAREMAPGLSCVTADPLAGAEADAPDVRLAEILADHVRATMASHRFAAPKVALVDHGSPVEVVTRVRDAVARQLAERLGGRVAAVTAASMERREGPEYAFNEPLLERVDGVEGFGGGDLLAAMFFLLPGRHAGPGGDVAGILEGLRARAAYGRIAMTPLLSQHLRLLELLQDRLEAALKR